MAEQAIVGRIRQNVLVQGRECWTMFETDSRNTYVVEDLASLGVVAALDEPQQSGLGGAIRSIERDCLLSCLVEGRRVRINGLVLPEIGRDEEGKRIEILFGALDMQKWGIVPVPQEERIDMSHYPDTWFEFPEVTR